MDESGEEGRIEEVMQIAQSLADSERPAVEVHDGYTRLDSATSGAFRFKWVAREQADGRFVVEETVGSSTVALTSLPMPQSEVVAYIDGRQFRHAQKIEDIRREWSVGLQGAAPSAEATDAAVLAGDAAHPSEPGVAAQPPANAAPAPRDPLEMYDEIRRMLKEQK